MAEDRESDAVGAENVGVAQLPVVLLERFPMDLRVLGGKLGGKRAELACPDAVVIEERACVDDVLFVMIRILAMSSYHCRRALAALFG